MDSQEILRAMQRLAREVQAIRRPMDQLIGLALRGETFDKAEVSNILRRESTQQELSRNWETVLYRHTSGQFVLICTTLPDNAKDAKILTTRRLINSREACAFCGLVENSFAPIELTVALSPVGIPIQAERVHPRCALSWQRLKLIAEGK